MKWLNIMETEQFCNFVSQKKLVFLLMVSKNVFWDESIFPAIHKFSLLKSFHFISLTLGEI